MRKMIINHLRDIRHDINKSLCMTEHKIKDRFVNWYLQYAILVCSAKREVIDLSYDLC